MATIKSLQRKLETLNTDKVIEESFVETKDKLAEENRKQLFEGFDKEQTRLRKYRNNKYARVKNQINPVPGLGNPDLKVTGSFYRGIKVEVSGQNISIESTDEKNDDLVDKYGKEIFGLGGKFKVEFIQQDLKPALHKRITDVTGLKFK